MMQRLRKRSLPVRVLVYAAVATLAFGLSAGVGAIGALMLRDDVGVLERDEPRPAEDRNAARSQEEEGDSEKVASRKDQPAAEQKGAASRKDRAEYVSTVGDIQARAVETFLKSHDKLLRYDALTADDVEEMRANEAALEEMAVRTGNLTPPEKYKRQYEAFDSAINELHEATEIAYGMAADPVAAAEFGFAEYDSHVSEASALLRRSNELLGRDYRTIGDVRRTSPQL